MKTKFKIGFIKASNKLMAKKLDSKPKASQPGSKDLAKKAYTEIRRMLFLNEITPGQKIYKYKLNNW